LAERLSRHIREQHKIIALLLSFELQEGSKSLCSESLILLLINDNDPSKLAKKDIHGDILLFDSFQQRESSQKFTIMTSGFDFRGAPLLSKAFAVPV
jgi:hypothetical protein